MLGAVAHGVAGLLEAVEAAESLGASKVALQHAITEDGGYGG